jgi:hypothetical protein
VKRPKQEKKLLDKERKKEFLFKDSRGMQCSSRGNVKCPDFKRKDCKDDRGQAGPNICGLKIERVEKKENVKG